MTVLAELKSLTQCFGNRVVLDNVTLQIQQGEILALLGPNGSGKTTLLKVLAFLLKPKSGEIRFQGEIVTDKNSERMRLQSGLVFQRTVLFSTSVFNNVAYGLKMRKTPKSVINEEVRKALKLVKLEGFEKRSAKKLSGGEQQRVALARALVLKNRLLLLDEPTANLDPKNASIIEEIILTVSRELKTTIVMATHNMFEAKTIPHRVALINNGRITEVGATSDIFTKLSRNLASFAAVENTFLGTARITEAGTTIVDVGNDVQIEAAFAKQGETSVFISPQDIILSKKPFESSARNVLMGRINQISDIGSLVKLTVDVGKPFTVQITKRSFGEMSLNLGAEVFIIFKASSVQEI
ncbi:MAG: ABC transporter ATP-binding protein [Candidatus Bathyarchaeia archaeon]